MASKDSVAIPLPLEVTKEKSSAPTTLRFFALTGAVLFFFLLNGLAAEKLFRIPGFKPYGGYLTLIQFLLYIGMSWSRLKMTGHKISGTSASRRTFAVIAFFTVATQGLSNASVGFMNYPTQLMFKSCKVIPVMIGGIFIQSKRYGFLEWCSMLMMTAGLVFFSLADQAVSPNFQYKGIIMVCLALCADAVIGNLQEKLMKEHKSLGNDEMIFRTYTIGLVYILIALISTGELFLAFEFCYENAWTVYPAMLTFALTAYLGFNFVLLLIKSFGAVTTVTVTTCRKAVTICLSFLFFAKPFVFQYAWSGMLVLGGIYLNLCVKKGLPIIPFTPAIQSFMSRVQAARLRRLERPVPIYPV